MANRWGIPKEVEIAVRKRDVRCIYCSVDFSIIHKSRKTKPTWEHIVNDVRINGKNNVAFCCGSCNASKGAKSLEDWLKSEYCRSRGITVKTVADVVKSVIQNPPKLNEKTL